MARERPTEGRAAKRGREREEGEKGRTGNGKRVRFGPMNEEETAREMSNDKREQFGTVRSHECDIKREIVSNLQPLKQ